MSCHVWLVCCSCQAFKKTVLAILRIRINFGSQKVNSAFFLFALCEKILPFYLSDDSTTHCDTGCYFVAISWWWFDYTRLSTGHWERFLWILYSCHLPHTYHISAHQGRLRQLLVHWQQELADGLQWPISQLGSVLSSSLSSFSQCIRRSWYLVPQRPCLTCDRRLCSCE